MLTMRTVYTAIVFAVMIAMSSGAISQHAPKAPQVDPQQKADSRLKQQEIVRPNTTTTLLEKKDKGQDGTAESNKEPPETYVAFGKSLKVTDTALAIFTLLIAYFTIELFLDGRDKAKKELRAYVALDDIYFRWNRSSTDPEDRSDIVKGTGRAPRTPRIRVLNFGKTPANNMTIRINGTKADLKESFPKTYLGRDHKVPRQMLSPTQRFGVWVPVSAEFNPDEAGDPNGRVRFVYGSIIYEDIYKRWWVNHFCYFYDPDPSTKNRFIPHTEYNHEDEKEYSSEDAARNSLTYI